MRIGLTGATGFIGRKVCKLAAEAGHEVIAYSRHPISPPIPGVTETFQQPIGSPWALPETPLDALIHLAGENLLGIWNAAKKQRIRDSRVLFTRNMVDHLAKWKTPPAALISASGIGYYGSRGDEELTEQSTPGSGFLAELCIDWEAAAEALHTLCGSRVATLRTGVVLGTDGGAFALQRTIFKLGIGGPLGSGKQWMSWIHADDEAALILRAATDSTVTGPINLCAPNPVTNAEYTRSLAKALHRPAFIPAPAFAMRLLMREMADEMLLCSQRGICGMAEKMGYRFAYPTLESALAQLVTPSH